MVDKKFKYGIIYAADDSMYRVQCKLIANYHKKGQTNDFEKKAS